MSENTPITAAAKAAAKRKRRDSIFGAPAKTGSGSEVTIKAADNKTDTGFAGRFASDGQVNFVISIDKGDESWRAVPAAAAIVALESHGYKVTKG